jgi:CheY-like chemotaxis protein
MYCGIVYQNVSILLLSDQTSYCYGLRRELGDRFGIIFYYVRTETEAVTYMKGIGIYADRQVFPLPDIFLLDTLHPDASDLRVLAWIREQPRFEELPLVILVAAPGEELVQTAFDIGANAYLIQREELSGLEEIMAAVLEAKWLRNNSELAGEDDGVF